MSSLAKILTIILWLVTSSHSLASAPCSLALKHAKHLCAPFNPNCFLSKQNDAELGLNFSPFRAAESRSGKSTSYLKGVNLYEFAANSPPNANDPDGAFAHILIGTATGFVIGGGVSVISDLYHGRDVDWHQAAISGTEAAIAGTVAAATFGASMPANAWIMAGRGALSGLAGDLAAQGAGLYAGTRDCFSASEAIISTGLGLGAPFLGKAIGKGIGTIRASLNAAKTPATVDRIRNVAQQGYDYAVANPRVQGLNRMQLGKDAEVQATRWMRRWAERNDVNLGPGGLQFQVRGANSVPDVVFDPARQIFDFKLTPRAVRPAQTQNFGTDFPGYNIEYIFGP